LVNVADASFSLTTSVASGVETASASTGSRSVADRASNLTAAGPIGGNKIDKKAPGISIASPAAISYTRNQAVVATYACTDGGSGVVACSGTVGNGLNIDTSSAGTKTFSVSATDNVGNTSTAAVTYTVNETVVYNFSGFLAPVNNPPTVNTGRAGRTYPVKWQLRDATGGFISTLSAVKSITYQATSCTTFNSSPTDPLEASTAGNSGLRYDSTANQYIYNWATPGKAACYSLYLTLANGQVFPGYFNLN
jgi:hypothetical protein